MNSQETERKAFEAWAAGREGYGTAGKSPDYALGAVRNAWTVWQARAALAHPDTREAVPMGHYKQLVSKTIGFSWEPGELQPVNADDLLRLIDALASPVGTRPTSGQAEGAASAPAQQSYYTLTRIIHESGFVNLHQAQALAHRIRILAAAPAQAGAGKTDNQPKEPT